MSLVMRACDYLYVLDFGELISTGRPERVREDSRVIEAYLGAAESRAEPEPAKVRSRRKLEVLQPVATTPLLEVEAMSAGYGGIEVVRGITLTVGHGEIVACIGANGAGKTTTLRAISGIIRASRGKVVFDGKDVTKKSPESIVRLGMLHIPQGRGLFPQLTVGETLRLASYSGATTSDLTPALDAFPMLKTRLNQAVGTLSGGQQQMVALARALLVKPKLLFLDEMSQGLAPAVVQQLFERVELFRSSGTSVFLVEQFVDSALAIADRAYVFEQGTVAVEGPASVMRRDRDVIAGAYLGTAVAMADVNGNGHHAPTASLAELSIKLPAELKRAVQERAAREGKEPGEMVAELLGAKGREK
jgi:ABC-type branched-subunit amino acid transport system ATPase component